MLNFKQLLGLPGDAEFEKLEREAASSNESCTLLLQRLFSASEAKLKTMLGSVDETGVSLGDFSRRGTTTT